jgi:y4mF family transcriptional regulator
MCDPAATAARLGETIRRERRARGLRQDDLALAAGLGLRAIHDIEAGKSTAQLDTWLNAIEALGLVLVIERERRDPRSYRRLEPDDLGGSAGR